MAGQDDARDVGGPDGGEQVRLGAALGHNQLGGDAAIGEEIAHEIDQPPVRVAAHRREGHQLVEDLETAH